MNADVPTPARRVACTTLAPAKINLDLRLLGLRADGYHLVSTTLQSIALADRVSLTPHEGPFALACDVSGVPTDDRNLAWRGATAMAAHLGVSLDGWRLDLEKVVPHEAGLGGGSADAVAAARLVAWTAGADLSPDELAGVVRPLGADVAFFAWGGTVRGEGVGDELVPLDDEPDALVVLVRPAFGVSTREAYGWHDADPPAADRAPGRRLNDLEPPVVAHHQEIGAIVSRLAAAGAHQAAMSGSGSACFGLFAPGTATDAVLDGWPAGTRVWATRLLTRAAHVQATTVTALAHAESSAGLPGAVGTPPTPASGA